MSVISNIYLRDWVWKRLYFPYKVITMSSVYSVLQCPSTMGITCYYNFLGFFFFDLGNSLQNTDDEMWLHSKAGF